MKLVLSPSFIEIVYKSIHTTVAGTIDIGI